MLKIICFIALFAAANAQLWPWPQPDPQPLPIVPEAPTLIEPNPPMQRPRPPIVQDNPFKGARDSRCPRFNGLYAEVYPHESDCSKFVMCNDGIACKLIGNL